MTTAAINPALLEWARETAGYELDDVARKLSKSPEAIAEWETGQGTPTVPQLEQLASIYKRPLAVFLLRNVPSATAFPHDFRTPYGHAAVSLSPATRLAIRTSRRLLREAKRLEARLSVQPPFSVSVSGRSAERDAEYVRRVLVAEGEEPLRWGSVREAFNDWRGRLEASGIYTLQFTMPVDEVRGFSVGDDDRYAIVVNSRDSLAARIFTLLHEVGHIARGTEGICNVSDATKRVDETTERWCNRFAGALLVPEEDLRPLVPTPITTGKEVDALCSELSDTFKVSRYVALHRLKDLALITANMYGRRFAAWSSGVQPQKKSSKGGPRPARKTLANKGPKLVSLVLAAEAEGVITASDVSELLEVKQKHIDELERLTAA